MRGCSNWIGVVMLASALARAGLAAGSVSDEAMPRVRAVDPRVAGLIESGTRRSATFKQLIERIDTTDGIVYIDVGVCRPPAVACLPHSMTQAGPNRVLHIVINTRRAPREIVASIAHELSHALEVLAEHAIRDGAAIFNFYSRQGLKRGDGFETQEAVDTEIKVRSELGGDFDKTTTDLAAKR